MTAAEDFLPSSQRKLAVPCHGCPAYVDPMQAIQVSVRCADGAWEVRYLCGVCAAKAEHYETTKPNGVAGVLPPGPLG